MRTDGRKRRVVVGDIHGELDGFREILGHAGLINADDDWAGGDTILIQTGDVIDRGPESIRSVSLLRKLQSQAPGLGGEVIRLCGNHELELLKDGVGFADFQDSRKLARELKEEVASGLLRAAYTDSFRLYTHAGLRTDIKEYLVNELKEENPKLQDTDIDLFTLAAHINRVFKESVENNEFGSHPIYNVDKPRGGNKKVGGIFWGDYSLINKSLNAWTIPQIFGHTPAHGTNVQHSQGLKLINIDAGMCEYYGSFRVYLEITGDGEIIQHSRGKTTKKWESKVIGNEPTAWGTSSFPPCPGSPGLETETQLSLEARLFNAVKEGDYKEVRGLIEEGANVNAKDEEGKLPLDYALTHRSLEKVLMLLESTDVSQRYLLAGDVLAFLGEVLKDAPYSFDLTLFPPWRLYPLVRMMRTMEIVCEHLFCNGWFFETHSIFAHTKMCLISAVEESDLDMIKFIATYGQDDLKKMLKQNKYGLVDLFKDMGIRIYDMDIDAFQWLLKVGADINARDKLGQNPLIWFFANYATPTFIINYGGDKIKSLVKSGCDVNRRDNKGRTALMHMILTGKNRLFLDLPEHISNIVQFLIDGGADVNVRDNLGRTALMYAAEFDNIVIARKLIENGADLHTKDKEGNSALSIAQRKGFKGIESLFRKEQKGVKGIIAFTTDILTARKLQNKLREYRKRLETIGERQPRKQGMKYKDTLYKIAILERLLLDGEVNTRQLSQQISEKYGEIDHEIFEGACGVLEDYARTGGKNVRGGTGLRGKS